MRFERPRKSVTVRREWFALYPRKDHSFWLAVAKRVRDRKVRHSDHVTIRAICNEVNSDDK